MHQRERHLHKHMRAWKRHCKINCVCVPKLEIPIYTSIQMLPATCGVVLVIVVMQQEATKTPPGSSCKPQQPQNGSSFGPSSKWAPQLRGQPLHTSCFNVFDVYFSLFSILFGNVRSTTLVSPWSGSSFNGHSPSPDHQGKHSNRGGVIMCQGATGGPHGCGNNH